jgi:bacterioferritin
MRFGGDRRQPATSIDHPPRRRSRERHENSAALAPLDARGFDIHLGTVLRSPLEVTAMKGNSEVVQHLNKVLANEQSAYNQYLMNSQFLKNWGMEKMAETEKEEAMEEIGHAEILLERILYLEGTPKMEGGKPAHPNADVKEVLEHNLKLEVDGIADLREGIEVCNRVGDWVSRELMVKILTDEEHHEDHLITQLELIEKVGIENYITKQM